MSESRAADDKPQPAWRPLNPTQRRVLGVLMEKAKTTPEGYPMTLKGITTACNQKSNRDPQMELEPDQVEEALEALREMKAVGEIQGDGRVSKYRHYAYEWFGVDKEEMAIMAELLLRGEQTVGELRGRAARMEPISGLEELLPILSRMRQRKLVVALTPAGRGQMVTHGLYKDRELDDLARRFGNTDHVLAPPPREPAEPVAPSPRVEAPASKPAPAASNFQAEWDALRAEVKLLREEVEEIKKLLS